MTETETVEVPWNSNRVYTVDYYHMKHDKESRTWELDTEWGLSTSNVGVGLDLPDNDVDEWSDEWVRFDETIYEYFDDFSDLQKCWDKKFGMKDGHDIKIVNVYMSKEQLFTHYAPMMNFEYDPDQLLELALKRGFVTDTDNGYKINNNY